MLHIMRGTKTTYLISFEVEGLVKRKTKARIFFRSVLSSPTILLTKN